MNWDFSNAKIEGSSIGPHARTYNTADPGHSELLRRLDDLRETLADDPSGRHAGVVGLIDDLERSVATGGADPAALAGRWDRIRAALGTTLQTTANVAQISSLVVQLAQG